MNFACTKATDKRSRQCSEDAATHISAPVICKEKLRKLDPVNLNRMLDVLRIHKVLVD